MTGSRVASFHLVREQPGAAGALRAMARLGTDRRRLAQTPGLRFWRLLGTGRGRDTGLGIDPRRTALFAVWESDDALDGFLARSPVAGRWAIAAEAYSVRLRGLGGHGAWRGHDVVGAVAPVDAGPPPAAASAAAPSPGPVAILTRAAVRMRHWRPFVSAGHRVSTELAGAAGLLAVAAIGEAPLGRQATFSLWRTLDDATAFAHAAPEHVDAVRRTRAEGWYGEELFARFRPYASIGTWDGRDPLNPDDPARRPQH